MSLAHARVHALQIGQEKLINRGEGVGPSLIPRPSLRKTTSGLGGSCRCVGCNEVLVVDRRNKDCVN